MKKKISVSLDECLVEKIEGEIQDGFFRNRSHLIELAISKFINNLRED